MMSVDICRSRSDSTATTSAGVSWSPQGVRVPNASVSQVFSSVSPLLWRAGRRRRTPSAAGRCSPRPAARRCCRRRAWSAPAWSTRSGAVHWTYGLPGHPSRQGQGGAPADGLHERHLVAVVLGLRAQRRQRHRPERRARPGRPAPWWSPSPARSRRAPPPRRPDRPRRPPTRRARWRTGTGPPGSSPGPRRARRPCPAAGRPSASTPRSNPIRTVLRRWSAACCGRSRGREAQRLGQHGARDGGRLGRDRWHGPVSRPRSIVAR